MNDKEVMEKIASFFIDRGFMTKELNSNAEFFIKLEDGDILYYRVDKINRPSFHNGWPIATKYRESSITIDMTYGGHSHPGADYDYTIESITIKMDDELNEVTKHLTSRPSLRGIMRNYRLKELGI
jgi:hypothetical protein